MKPALGSGTERKGSVARYSGCRTELSWLLMVPEGGKFASLGKQVPVPCTELEHLRRGYTLINCLLLSSREHLRMELPTGWAAGKKEELKEGI